MTLTTDPVAVNTETIVKEDVSKYRHFTGPLYILIVCISTLIVALTIFYIMGFLTTDILFLFPVQVNCLGLILIFLLVFITVPAVKGPHINKVPWYDILILLAGVIPCLYLVIIFPDRFNSLHIQGVHELILGILLLLALFEATRRTVGWVFLSIVLLFFFYPFICSYLPGVFQSRQFDVITLVERMYLSGLGIFGSFLSLAFSIMYIFLIFAAFLEVTGVGRFFVDLAMGIGGRYRGGPAKVAILASSLLGTVCGNSVANVAATGCITIPLMKRIGYEPHFAGAIEAVASVGGQLVPPVLGAVAFVMADVLGVSYWTICIAAIIPAILYYTALYVQVDAEAVRLKLKGLPREQLPSALTVLKRRGYLLVPIFVLLYFLGFRAYSPAISCLYSLISLILLSMIGKETRLNLHKLTNAMTGSAKLVLSLTIILASASIISATVNMTGLGSSIASSVVTISGGNLAIMLILAAVACYVFGMVMPSITAYLLVALLITPATIKAGVVPLAAHFFVLYYALVGHFTPPVGPASYVAAGIAEAGYMRTGIQAMRLGAALLIVPMFIAYQPALLMIGDPVTIIIAAISAFIGTVLIAGGIGGYLAGSKNMVQRAVLFIAGLLIIWPDLPSTIVGIVLGGLVLIPWATLFRKRVPTDIAK